MVIGALEEEDDCRATYYVRSAVKVCCEMWLLMLVKGRGRLQQGPAAAEGAVDGSIAVAYL